MAICIKGICSNWKCGKDREGRCITSISCRRVSRRGHGDIKSLIKLVQVRVPFFVQLFHPVQYGIAQRIDI